MFKTACLAIIFVFALAGAAVAAPVITVVNDANLGNITFGFDSYKIVNGSSTRQGTGSKITVSSSAQFSDFPPMAQGDQLFFDKGLRIYNQKRNMTSDGSPTCTAAGVASGLTQLFGRGYITMQDRFTVQVTAQQTVIEGVYNAVCTYGR